MHETPRPFRWDDDHHEPLFGEAFPYFDSSEEEVESEDCRLFSICEAVARRFVSESLYHDHPEVVRRLLETQIRRKFDLPADRAAGLFDLALELIQLQVSGRYHRSIAEVGRLIAFVSCTDLAPENN